jgi:predicted RNase H-like HicB family nuclease
MKIGPQTLSIAGRIGGRLFLIGAVVVCLFRLEKLALKLRDVRTEITREDNGTYAVACSALGVYSVGKTLKEAKRNFEQALDLHLSVVREKARKDLTRATVSP